MLQYFLQKITIFLRFSFEFCSFLNIFKIIKNLICLSLEIDLLHIFQIILLVFVFILASSTNQNENITEEISVTGDKMPSAAEVGKSTGNPEDEAFETENQSNSSNNLFTKDESNSKSPLLKNSLLSDISKDNVLLQENKKNFPQEEKLSNTADNSNSQRENDKEDGDPSNKQNINKTTNKILDSDDDDDDDIYTSLKLNKKTLKPTTKKVFTFDSDSEDENIFTSKKQSNEETVSVSEMSESIDLAVNSVKRSRIMNIVDSDSDDESINIKEKEKSQDQIHVSLNVQLKFDTW